MKTYVQGVQAHQIDRYWPFAEPYLKRVIERFADEYTLDDVFKQVSSNDMQLWLGYTNDRLDGAAITKIIDYPTCRVCLCIMLAGSMASLDHTEQVEPWIRGIGCDRIWAYCRPGLAKRLSRVGFKETSRVMEKRL